VRDPLVECAVAAPEIVEDHGDDLPALDLVGDRTSPRRQVGLSAPLQVEGELVIGEQVRVPVAAPRGAAQEDAAVVAIEPHLDSPGLTATTADRGDVDGSIALERPTDAIVHHQTGRAVARPRI